MSMRCLYDQSPEAFRYWQVWRESDGRVITRSGIVGERGQMTEALPRPDESQSGLIERHTIDAESNGFRSWPDEELLEVVLQYPPLAGTLNFTERLWAGIEQSLDDALTETGLDYCDSVDYAGELTFISRVVERDAAVRVIRAVAEAASVGEIPYIAVDEDDRYVVVWPEDAAGEEIF